MLCVICDVKTTTKTTTLV